MEDSYIKNDRTVLTIHGIFLAVILVLISSCNLSGSTKEVCNHQLCYEVGFSSKGLDTDSFPDMIIETCKLCSHRATMQIITVGDSCAYTGSEVTPGGVITSDNWLGTESIAGKFSYENNVVASTDDNNATMTLTIYGVTIKKKFVIEKQKIKEPTSSLTRIIDTGIPVCFTDNRYLENYRNQLDKIEVTADSIVSAASVGEYKIKFKLKNQDNYCWENHDSDYLVQINWEIVEYQPSSDGITAKLPDDVVITEEIPAGTLTKTAGTDFVTISFEQTNKDNSDMHLYYWCKDGKVVSFKEAKEGGLSVPSINIDLDYMNYKVLLYEEDAKVLVNLTVASAKGSNTYQMYVYASDFR